MTHRIEGLTTALQAIAQHTPEEIHTIRNLLCGLQFCKDIKQYHPVIDKAEKYVTDKGKQLFANNRLMNKTSALSRKARQIKRNFLETDLGGEDNSCHTVIHNETDGYTPSESYKR